MGKRNGHDSSVYKQALSEYQNAIRLAPFNIGALNNYAYCFWRWRLKALLQQTDKGPDVRVAENAEAYARSATLLASYAKSKTLHTEIQSTLGEVLLAKDRPHEAADVLLDLNNDLPKSDNAEAVSSFYDEIRWDLAQAYSCLSYDDARFHEKKAHHESDKAAKAFNEVRLLSTTVSISRSHRSRGGSMLPVHTFAN